MRLRKSGAAAVILALFQATSRLEQGIPKEASVYPPTCL